MNTDATGVVESLADRICALTGIRRVRQQDSRRAELRRTMERREEAANALRRIADDLEKDI